MGAVHVAALFALFVCCNDTGRDFGCWHEGVAQDHAWQLCGLLRTAAVLTGTLFH